MVKYLLMQHCESLYNGFDSKLEIELLQSILELDLIN